MAEPYEVMTPQIWDVLHYIIGIINVVLGFANFVKSPKKAN